MKKLIICTVVLTMLIASCNSRTKKPQDLKYIKTVYTQSYPITGSTYVSRYTGTVPGVDSLGIDTLGIDFELTISRNEYAPEGAYILIAHYTDEKTNKKASSTSRGRVQILRGIDDDVNKTIYKLTDEIDENNLYFKKMSDNKLRLINNLADTCHRKNEELYDISLLE